MKKINHLIGAALCALTITSCASYQNTAPLMGVRSNGINTYVKADLDYNSATKVEAVVETQTLFGFIALKRNGNKTLESSNRYRGLSKNQKRALYRAKKDSGSDLILEPQFETEKHSWFFGLYKESVTKVVGWGVKVKGIKEDNMINPYY